MVIAATATARTRPWTTTRVPEDIPWTERTWSSRTRNRHELMTLEMLPGPPVKSTPATPATVIANSWYALPDSTSGVPDVAGEQNAGRPVQQPGKRESHQLNGLDPNTEHVRGTRVVPANAMDFPARVLFKKVASTTAMMTAAMKTTLMLRTSAWAMSTSV